MEGEIEKKILLYFLKHGYSTRQLDSMLGLDSQKSKGYPSWEVLKKYGLKTGEKFSLFLYGLSDCRKIIDTKMKNPSLNIANLKENFKLPRKISKYQGTFVECPGVNELYDSVSGETRNLVQSFFKNRKAEFGVCQYNNCNNTDMQIDTVHVGTDRKSIFLKAASIHAQIVRDGCYRFNLYDVMVDFMLLHAKPKKICFLCKEHHLLLTRLENSDLRGMKDFIKNIEFS